MDWTAGYASDIEYVAGFYREQSPAWINFVCLLNGIQPVPLDQPFNYCELGSGRGLTAQLLAAASPHAQFYAADFNPSHVAESRALAAQAQLGNLTLLEKSFEQLANGDVALPQFDFITLHGIYTWVTAQNRQHIVRFIGRYLKPGGLVYVSYNALPGWSAALPLQRLLVEYGDMFPGRSDVQIRGATEFIGQMEDAQAAYLAQHPSLKARVQSLKTSNPHYLVHEYMHKHWQPMFHADVARDLAAAKMTFAGSADLPFAYPALYLNDQRSALLNRVSDPAMRETMKDYFLNTSFRKDVFVRGARRLAPIKQTELLATMGLALTVPRAATTLKMSLSFGEVNGRADLYEAVLDALVSGPCTLAELCRLPALSGQSLQNVGQIAVLLCASGQAAFYFPSVQGADHAAARRLNAVLAAQGADGDDYAALCSPLLASGFSANLMDRLFYLGVQRSAAPPTADALAAHAWQMLARTGRRMQRNGVALETADENVAELTAKAGEFLLEKLPVLRQLNIL